MTDPHNPRRAGLGGCSDVDRCAALFDVNAYTDPRLRRVLFAIDAGRNSASELGHRLDINHAELDRLVERLETDRLIERTIAHTTSENRPVFRTRIPVELGDAAWSELPEATRGQLVDAITTEIESGLASSREAGLLTRDDAHVSRLVL